MSRLLARVAAWSVGRRTAVLAATAFATLVGTAGALQLSSEAGTETLVDRDSETFAATERFKERFGDDAIVVLVKGDLEELMLTDNLGRILKLEGCLAGKVPEGAAGAAPVCSEIRDLNAVRVVYGPATFLNQSVIQAEAFFNREQRAAILRARRAARAAALQAREQGASEAAQRQAALQTGAAVLKQFEAGVLNLAVRYGLTGPPRISDPRFVSQVIFDSRVTGGVPKARFAYLFPSPDAALISIRLRPELSEEERSEAIGLIRHAVADNAFRLDGGSYTVSGVPVVVDELSGELSEELLLLLGVALLVMAVMLALVFRPPLRLLPLPLALVAAALAFGVLGLGGGSLTMATVAVLPVLIGLAVDYAIQLQARFRETSERSPSAVSSAREAAARGGPVIAVAVLATAAGFLVLLLSPIPMVRGFGLLLVLGIAFAYVTALTSGFAALSIRRPGPSKPQQVPASRSAGWTKGRRVRQVADRLQGAGTSLGARFGEVGKRTIAVAIARPGRVILAALVLALGGWIAGTQTEVTSDLRQLVPGDLLARAGVDELQEETGVSGELNVIVTAPDITDPEVVAWMAEFKERVLAQGGFGGEFPSCEAARLCPQIALTDLFSQGRGNLTPRQIDAVLEAVPAYFSQAVVSRDPETGELGDTANIAFGIRVMPLEEQKELIDSIREEIDPSGTELDPPPGVDAEVAGLPALAADANADLSDSRYWLTLASLAAVAIVLLVAYRSFARAFVPLIPIVLATGWSALVLAAMGISLNPMSATLGALVVAIATEFSVILSARYREERAAGRSVGDSLRITYSRTGAAVLASGLTAIAGFAVLLASGIKMLREFGLVTVVDLGVALVGVLIVLPAALVWSESGFQPLRAAGGAVRRRVARVVPARSRP